MPMTVAALFAVSLLVVLFIVVGLTIYNNVVAMRQRIGKAWANIEVALQQRHDELPNLVNAVRDVMAFEQDVLEEVTRQRAAYSPTAPIGQQAAVSQATSAAIRSLFAVVERYPELKSEGNVLSLQEEIERLENVIADRREFYNDSVYRYNATIAQLPATLLAGLAGWQPQEFFSAEPDASVRPDVALRPS